MICYPKLVYNNNPLHLGIFQAKSHLLESHPILPVGKLNFNNLIAYKTKIQDWLNLIGLKNLWFGGTESL